MTVGIADVAADLVLVLFRRRQELGTPGAPFRVQGVDVFDPDIEETADPVGIARRLRVTPMSVSRWHAAWVAEGVAGLASRGPGGDRRS